MSKMSEIDLMLQEYEENLHMYGHGDPLVVILKHDLAGLKMEDVNTMVAGIDAEFDTIVFTNQTEGRF